MNTWKPPAADKPGWTKPRKERLLWGLYVSVPRTVHPLPQRCCATERHADEFVVRAAAAVGKKGGLLGMSLAHRDGRQQGSIVVPQAADEGGGVTGDHAVYDAVVKAGGPRHTSSSVDAAGDKLAAGVGR